MAPGTPPGGYRISDEERAENAAWENFKNFERNPNVSILLSNYLNTLNDRDSKRLFIDVVPYGEKKISHLQIMNYILSKDPKLGTRLLKDVINKVSVCTGLSLINIWMQKISNSLEVLQTYRNIDTIIANNKKYVNAKKIIENRILQIELTSATPMDQRIVNFFKNNRSYFHRFSKEKDALDIYQMIKNNNPLARNEKNKFEKKIDKIIKDHVFKLEGKNFFTIANLQKTIKDISQGYNVVYGHDYEDRDDADEIILLSPPFLHEQKREDKIAHGYIQRESKREAKIADAYIQLASKREDKKADTYIQLESKRQIIKSDAPSQLEPKIQVKISHAKILEHEKDIPSIPPPTYASSVFFESKSVASESEAPPPPYSPRKTMG